MSDSSRKMGLWEADREEIEHKPAGGAGLYSELDEQLEFRAAVLRLAEAEHASTGSEVDAAYFVLGDKQLFEKVRSSAARVPMLQNAAKRSRPLLGNLWFVPRALALGFAIDVRGRAAEDVFQYIEALGAGDHPTIVVDPHPRARVDIYPEGVSNPNASEVVDLSVKTVAVDDIEMALNGLYQLIRSPDQMKPVSLWEQADKWHPVEQAEGVMQNQVTRALAGRFAHFAEVRSEQPSTIGRTDVELIQTRGLPPGSTIRHALIELKVLRSYGSTGKPVSDKIIQRHISQGVRQAAQYGNASNSRIRILCCYDMRKKDIGDAICFQEFYGPCEERKVCLKRYFLYNSSEALRQALDNAAIAVGANPLPE